MAFKRKSPKKRFPLLEKAPPEMQRRSGRVMKKGAPPAAQSGTAHNGGSNFTPNICFFRLHDSDHLHKVHGRVTGLGKLFVKWCVCVCVWVGDAKTDSNGSREAHSMMLWLVEVYCILFGLYYTPVFKRSYSGFQLVPELVAASASKDSAKEFRWKCQQT